MELRKTFDIKIKDAMEIYVDDEAIILKKYEPACIFCGNAQNIVNYSGKNICKECVAKLADSIK
jgi:transcriptional pleiotropic regulator of transition state genes